MIVIVIINLLIKQLKITFRIEIRMEDNVEEDYRKQKILI